MKKFIALGFLILLVLVYLFLNLGIELELKSVVERMGAKLNQLVDTSFKIRNFSTIQLLLFIVMFLTCIYLLFKKNKPERP